MANLMEKDFRLDFPMLHKKENGNALIYFDNAATTFKPQVVIDAIVNYYQSHCSTVHRSIYDLANKTGQLYYEARQKVQKFLGASSSKEIIFTSGATSSINLVAHSYGDAFIQKGDEILISEIEHHSDLVPWQMLADRKGAILKFFPVKDSGDIDLDALGELLNSKTKLVSLAHVSNVLGAVHPIKEIIRLVRKQTSAKVLVDGAQAVSHMPIDVVDLDADFYVFSSHKIYGPTGLGVLYGKEEHLEKMPPLFGGGDMIQEVSKEKTTYNELPFKFEAGTPHIAGVLGLSAAIDYVTSIGFETIQTKENELLKYALEKLSLISGVKIMGDPKERASLISFYINQIHNLDLATLLNLRNIAVRSGHLCAQTAMERFKTQSMLRLSFAFYNTIDEVNVFLDALQIAINKLI